MRLLLFVGTGVVLAVLFVVALVVVFRVNRPSRGAVGGPGSAQQQPGHGQQPGYGQQDPGQQGPLPH